MLSGQSQVFEPPPLNIPDCKVTSISLCPPSFFSTVSGGGQSQVFEPPPLNIPDCKSHFVHPSFFFTVSRGQAQVFEPSPLNVSDCKSQVFEPPPLNIPDCKITSVSLCPPFILLYCFSLTLPTLHSSLLFQVVSIKCLSPDCKVTSVSLCPPSILLYCFSLTLSTFHFFTVSGGQSQVFEPPPLNIPDCKSHFVHPSFFFTVSRGQAQVFEPSPLNVSDCKVTIDGQSQVFESPIVRSLQSHFVHPSLFFTFSAPIVRSLQSHFVHPSFFFTVSRGQAQVFEPSSLNVTDCKVTSVLLCPLFILLYCVKMVSLKCLSPDCKCFRWSSSNFEPPPLNIPDSKVTSVSLCLPLIILYCVKMVSLKCLSPDGKILRWLRNLASSQRNHGEDKALIDQPIVAKDLFHESKIIRVIMQRRAWLLLGWVTAERSCSCKQPAYPDIGGGSKVNFAW
ncbi:hypothetical protein J6590_017326 [Homalodisca vitripennis]|nr:hypothetical protein J6590_017326 [Homalodisca vitripennis]